MCRDIKIVLENQKLNTHVIVWGSTLMSVLCLLYSTADKRAKGMSQRMRMMRCLALD